MKRLYISLLCILGAVTLNAGNKVTQKQIEKQIVAPTFRDADYVITDYGAVEGGIEDAREAITKAVDRCTMDGGGRVVIPSGKFFCKGPVVIKSNVNLHFEDGAELIFSNDEKDYLPAVLTRWEGTEVYNYSPLIYARDVINVAITGKGTINGQGKSNFVQWKKNQLADQLAIRKMGTDGVPVYQRVFGEGHILRPAVVEFVSCSRILFEDFKVVDNTFWCTHLIASENITVRNIKIDSENFNADGCDPESCRNVLIEGCYFHAGDDGIAIKSGRDQDGWRMGQPTENVIIRNCTFDTPSNGICIGSEISGGIRNIFVENIKVVNANNAIYFKSNLDRGGYMTDIHVKGMTVEHTDGCLIKFDPDYKSESKHNFPTPFKRFEISDVKAGTVDRTAIEIFGFADLPIEDITISNVTVEKAKKATDIRNVKNVVLKKITVDGQKYDTIVK